ncbi:hypothetical protein CSC2_42020 [Clostridium zeae]|uniref:Uncharacterized protein n=1 Tax=Clostridium zeae TaxID=2759022 RepID=A0ABQ1EFU5_9CLOT|nr:hypothetical protein CSC2_42020 [Clostridium zeae]
MDGADICFEIKVSLLRCLILLAKSYSMSGSNILISVIMLKNHGIYVLYSEL